MLLLFLCKADKFNRSTDFRYDRGADFISTPVRKRYGSRPEGKGKLPKDFCRQEEKPWDAAEYASDCHLCGALSTVM